MIGYIILVWKDLIEFAGLKLLKLQSERKAWHGGTCL